MTVVLTSNNSKHDQIRSTSRRQQAENTEKQLPRATGDVGYSTTVVYGVYYGITADGFDQLIMSRYVLMGKKPPIKHVDDELFQYPPPAPLREVLVTPIVVYFEVSRGYTFVI